MPINPQALMEAKDVIAAKIADRTQSFQSLHDWGVQYVTQTLGYTNTTEYGQLTLGSLREWLASPLPDAGRFHYILLGAAHKKYMIDSANA